MTVPGESALFAGTGRLRREVIGDGPIVSGRSLKRGQCQLSAKFGRDLSVSQLLQHGLILFGVGDDRHIGMVLRRRADHAGTADVDLLDRLFQRDAGLRDGFLERIEIAHDDLKRNDAVVANGRGVGGQIGPAEDGTVHLRVQRLDAAVHDFGKPGVRRDIDHGDGVFLEKSPGSARGDDLKTQVGQPAGKGSQTGFIADADQRSVWATRS